MNAKTVRSLLQPLAVILMLATGAPRAQAAPATVANTFHPDNNFALLTEADGISVNIILPTSDGGFLVGGEISTIGTQLHSNLAKFKSDGTVDSTFNQSTRFDGRIEALAVQQNGRILVGGRFLQTVNGTTQNGIVRLNTDGTIDTSFVTGSGFTDDYVYDGTEKTAFAIQADGRILVIGAFTNFNGTPRRHIARLNTDGSLDTSFNPGANLGGSIHAIAVQADGKILVGGWYTDVIWGTPRKNVLVRLNTDGSVDPSFSFDPGDSDSSKVETVAVLTDGRILVGGEVSGYDSTTKIGASKLMRLNSSGSRDTSFNNASYTIVAGPYGNVRYDQSVFVNRVTKIAIQSDGCVVGISSGEFKRLNTDGSNDTSLSTGTGFSAGLSALALQTNGRIVVGGAFKSYNGTAAINIARLTSTGALDPLTTGNPRRASRSVTIQTTGNKLFVAGNLTWINGNPCNYVVRVNADSTIDTSFNNNNVFTITGDSIIKGAAVQADGRIVIIGSFSKINDVACKQIARLNTNGSLDTTFNTGTGPSDVAPVGHVTCYADLQAITLQANGQILVGGYFDTFNGVTCNGLVRLNSNGSVDPSLSTGTGFIYNLPLMPGWWLAGNFLSITEQADGRIIVNGFFDSYNGSSCKYIARLNANGSFDATYNPSTGGIPPAAASGDVVAAADTSTGNTSDYKASALQPDGRLIIAGDFTTIGGTARNRIARLNTNGTLDTTFNPGTGFNDTVSSLFLQADGRILVGGYFTTFNGVACNKLVRLNADGTLDSRFTVSDHNSCVYGLNITDEGKLLLTDAVSRTSRQIDGFTLLTPDILPAFTTQPTSATVTAGGSATFTAAATGTPAPTFQWYKGTTALTGQTSATLSLTNVQAADAGSYTVVATNTAGSVTSTAATVAVNPTPTPPAEKKGGGGAPSDWYFAALLLALAAKRFSPRRKA